MAGRTTFVIAHRLSTISLADTIVVLEDGAVAAAGSHDALLEQSELYREIVEKGLPDQVFLTRKERERRWRACDVRGPRPPARPPAATTCAGACAARAGAARKLRGLDRAARALQDARGAHVRRAGGRHGGVAGARAAGQGGDRRRASSRATSRRSTSSSSPSWSARSSSGWRRYAQTYLVGWVGQRALADLRLQIFRHLQEMPVGFYERRPAGMLISRMTNDVEALDSLVTDTVVTLFQASLTLDRLGGDPALPRRPAGAADLPHLPGDGDRVAGLPHRQRRRLPAHARDDQRHHRLPAGDAVGHPRRARLRAGAAPPRALRRAQRRQPRRPTSSPSTSTPPTSRPSSSSRPSPPSASSSSADARRSTATSRSACSSASSPRSTASSTPSASSRRSTRPTSRAWRRSTRSSSCSTSRPS